MDFEKSYSRDSNIEAFFYEVFLRISVGDWTFVRSKELISYTKFTDYKRIIKLTIPSGTINESPDIAEMLVSWIVTFNCPIKTKNI